MIIDLILDRRDYEKNIREGYDSVQYPNGEIVSILYDPNKFYNSIVRYGEVGEYIARAFDSGSEEDVKKALCRYIDSNSYNPGIKRYINSRDWLTPDTMDSVLDEIDIMSSKRTGRKTIMSATPTYDSRMDDRFDAEIPDEFEIYDRIGKAYCKVSDYVMTGPNVAKIIVGVVSLDLAWDAKQFIERGMNEFLEDRFGGSDYSADVINVTNGLPNYMYEEDIVPDYREDEYYYTFTVEIEIWSTEHDSFSDDAYFNASRKIGKKRPVTASRRSSKKITCDKLLELGTPEYELAKKQSLEFEEDFKTVIYTTESYLDRNNIPYNMKEMDGQPRCYGCRVNEFFIFIFNPLANITQCEVSVVDRKDWKKVIKDFGTDYESYFEWLEANVD